jgi:hypothetical protein
MEERMTDKIKDGTEEELHQSYERARNFALAALSGPGRELHGQWRLSLVDAISEINAIVERAGHPDDTMHARLAMHALIGMWLDDDEIDASEPGEVPPMVSDGGPKITREVFAELQREVQRRGQWTQGEVNLENAYTLISRQQIELDQARAEVERLTQFATSLGKTLDARIGDVRRRDDEIESLRRQRAAERDVIKKAKALAAIEARQSDVRGLGGAGEWVKQQTEAVIAVCAAVDALGDSQGDTDGP